MKLFALGLTGLLISSFAQASNSVVICGETANADEFTVTGFELQVSTDGGEEYSGPVGGTWNMKIGSEDSEWLAPNKNIKANMKKIDDKTTIEIVMIQGRSPTGPVGTRYVIDDLYGEETTLEKWNFGGFTGKVMVGKFNCLAAVD